MSGDLVYSALLQGITPNPSEPNPYANPARRVFDASGGYYLIGGAIRSFVLTTGFPGGSGIGANHYVEVTPVANGGVVYAVTANGLALEGPQLDLRNVDPELNTTVATWSSGQWYASLVVTSIAEQPALMRVCWNVQLPPPAPLTGPPGYVPTVRTALLKRLMCGIYNRSTAGPDMGGYLIDDFDGVIRTFAGYW